MSNVPANVIGLFLRDKRKNPIGLAVALKDSSGNVKIGWSFVSKSDRKSGRNSKRIAWEIALARAKGGTNQIIPHSMHRILNNLADRAKRYFKVNNVEIVGN